MLILFDIDGTLVDSMKIEDEFYPKAVSGTLGIQNLNTNWESYPNSSDPGIVRTAIQQKFNREPTQKDFDACEECFCGYVQQNKNEYKPIAGAIEFLQHLKQDASITIALVTAAWRNIALLKLKYAGIELGNTLLLTATEHEDKYDGIIAAQKQLTNNNQPIEQLLYIGDTTCDLRNARKAGFKFIGIGERWTKPNQFNAQGVKDFRNRDEVLTIIQSIFINP